MSQADGYVRIVTQNDTAEAQRSTEQLGDTIQEALDTSPADKMTDVLLDIQKSIEQLGSTISSSTDQIVDAFGEVEDGLDDTGDAALKTGDIIKANLLSEAITKGIQALGSALKSTASNALNLALSNETAFAKASTLLKGDDFTSYYQGLIDISNRTGVAFSDLSESMYSALSAGVAQEKVLDFVESSVKLSKGGFTQTATAIDIVTTALNAYHMEMDEATHVQDVLITTQNLGKTTVDELASNMGKLIPTANGVNIAFDQLGAMYATVTANGVATAEATTYLNSMINELGASGSTAEKAMQEATKGTDMAGKKFSEISAMGYDVTDVLTLMSDYAQKTGKSLSDMFSSSEGAKAASILLSNVEGFKSNIDAMVDSTGAAATAAETMMDTTAEKIQLAKNQIDNLTSSIAEQLLPITGEAAQNIADALNSSELKETAQAVGDFIAGALTLLLKNINLIASAVTGVTAAFIAFKTAAMITKVIQSWQTAILQVKMLGTAQEFAAVKTAALNGQLTLQETIYAVLSGKLDIATAKQVALNTAMNLNPAAIIAAGVGLLATALTEFALNAQTASEETRNFSDELKDLQKSYDDEIASGEAELVILEKKVNRYEELRTQMNLTADETSELQGLADDLQSTFGDSIDVVDTLTGSYNSLTQAYNDYAAALRANVMSEAKKRLADDAASTLIELQKEYDEVCKQIENEEYDLPNGFMGIGVNVENVAEDILLGRKKELEDAIEEANSIIDEYINYNASFLHKTNADSITSNSETAKTGDFIDVEAEKKKFKSERDVIKKWYNLGDIDAATYYSTLEALRDKYLDSAIDSDEWYDATVEIKKYRDQLTEDQKKAYEKQLEAQKKADEEAKKQEENAIKEAAAARKQAYTDGKSELEFQLKTKQITEKKYYAALDKLRDKYLDKNSSEWRSAYLETYEYNQKIIQANKDALNQLLSDTSDSTLDALDKLISSRDSLTNKLKDFNKTFEKTTQTIPETVAVKGEFTITTAEHEEDVYKMGADSIEDNIKVLEDYGAMLDALKARGADESTLSSILDMDIEEGMKYGAELLKMSDSDWNSYFDSLEKLNNKAAEISAKYYQDQISDLKENFVDKLRSVFDGLSSDMYQVGVDVAEEFVKGWNKKMGTEDLTLGDIMSSVSTGTMATAPTAAKSMSALGAIVHMPSTLNSIKTNIPIYIGTQKLVDLIVDLTNGKIIQTGKNVLLT